MYRGNALIPSAGILMPGDRDRFVIGSSYKSDIFYKDGARIRPEHGKIFFPYGKEAGRLELCSLQGVSANLKEGERKSFEKGADGNHVLFLSYGDEIRIFGLWIRYYETFLMAGAWYGDMRLSVNGGERRDVIAPHR